MVDTPDTPVTGLAAVTGSGDPESASPKDPFNTFWSAFPRKYQKPKARAAWDKLAPDAELAERIIDAARQWASHYEAHPVDKKWMPTPANWLAGERYDEDVPDVYVDAKDAAIAKKKDRPVKADPAAPKPSGKGGMSGQLRILRMTPIGDPFGDYRVQIHLDGNVKADEREYTLKVLGDGGTCEDIDVFNKLQRAFGDNWVGGRVRVVADGDSLIDVIPEKAPTREVEIEDADIIQRDKEKVIVARLMDTNGDAEGTLEIVHESGDTHEQEHGQAQLRALMKAINLASLTDTDELLFKPFILTDRGDFEPVPASASTSLPPAYHPLPPGCSSTPL